MTAHGQRKNPTQVGGRQVWSLRPCQLRRAVHRLTQIRIQSTHAAHLPAPSTPRIRFVPHRRPHSAIPCHRIIHQRIPPAPHVTPVAHRRTLSASRGRLVGHRRTLSARRLTPVSHSYNKMLAPRDPLLKPRPQCTRKSSPPESSSKPIRW